MRALLYYNQLHPLDSTHIIEAVKLYQTLEKYQCVVSVTRSNKPSQIIRPLDDYSTLSF